MEKGKWMFPEGFKVKRINKHLYTWVGTFLFGAIGVDRFMRGQIVFGILKILSVLVFGIGGVWVLIDWFIALSKLGEYEDDFIFVNKKWCGFTGYGKTTIRGDYGYYKDYEGDLVNGKPHGKGKFIDSNGDVYEGEFVNGKEHGKGKVIFSDGRCYEGDFADGKFHGKGKMTYPNGEVEENEFVG